MDTIRIAAGFEHMQHRALLFVLRDDELAAGIEFQPARGRIFLHGGVTLAAEAALQGIGGIIKTGMEHAAVAA